MHIPMLPPFQLEQMAMDAIQKIRNRYKSFPKNASLSFECGFRNNSFYMEVVIEKP